MSGGTLDDEVAHAHAMEVRESRRAGLEPPSYHLGGPPGPWESAIGDTTARVVRQGRAVIDYAAKMNAMGIHEQSLAGDTNPIADHVASLGRDKMRLLPGGSALTVRKVAVLQGGKAQDESLDEDGAASVSSEDCSDFSDSDNGKNPTPADKGAAAGGNLDYDPDEEPSDDIDLMDDTEIRNAVEDFDSRNWTMDQLEVSCQTLLEECYASEDRRRRLLSAGMLRKLVEIYPSALRWMQRSLEAVVNDGLPSMIKGTLGARVFKLDILLGILAPAMAESMTQLNVVARLLRLMVFKMDTAVRVISFRYNLPKKLASYRELPSMISTHKRMTLLMQGSELQARWRNINANEKNGSLPASLLHSYLCIILALIEEETCPRLFRMNRIKVVGGGGLLALAVHFKAGDRSQRLACRILRELACEPLLIYELLNAGVTEYLSRLLPKLRESSIDRLLEALDALDSMAFSAMRFGVTSSANPDVGEGNSKLVSALVANGGSIGGLESEIRVPTGDKVQETVRTQLGLPHLMVSLIGLLDETDVQLYLAGVVILGKLASTVCYHSVLREILAYAGRALELLIQGLQSQEELVPEMSFALFLQLCSRQEGRDGIESSDGAAMLRPLISGDRAQESPVFLRGLACAVALARCGVPDPDLRSTGAGTTRSPTAPSGLSLPSPGGVGRSGPAKPHPLDLEGMLYNHLVNIFDAPTPAPAEAVSGLVRMGFLEAVMRFLVRDDGEASRVDDPSSPVPEAGVGVRTQGASNKGRGKKVGGNLRGPHYFKLKQRHACLGAVVLHGLVVLAGPHPAIFTGSTLQYLCYAIQVAYIDITVGRLAPGVDYPLVFRSIQLACRALAFLATSDSSDVPSTGRKGEGKTANEEQKIAADNKHEEDHGPLRRVADSLISTTAINEVACMAQMPSRASWVGDDGGMYQHLERTVSSAAILIAGVCPVPAGERDPFSRFDEPEDEQRSLKVCQALMERLVTIVGGALCSTLMLTDSLEIIAHACRALCKLSDANTTAQMLLDSHQVMKAIIRLGPKAPAVLLATKPREPQEAREGSLSPIRSGRVGGGGVVVAKRCAATRVDAAADEHDGLTSVGRKPCQTQAVEGRRTGPKPEQARENSGESDGEGEQLKQGWEHRGVGKSRWDCGIPMVQPPSSGYDVREGEMADASTRKLCSLPFDYFRLVANVARVPSGRAILQSSGTLKRCLERLAFDVSGCPAAQLATLRCRSEICVLLGRMAGTYDRDTGAANDFILCARYRAVGVMIAMLDTAPEIWRWLGGSRAIAELARHNAAFALAELCRDTLKSVPLVASAGGVQLACKVLRILQAVGSFPDGAYASSIADPALLRSLHRIANSAYPGFRPAPVGGDAPSLSASVRARKQTPAQRQPASGREVANLSEGCPPSSTFGVVKPRSPEADMISELAREVAYLAGAGARLARSPASQPGQEKTSTTKTFEKMPSKQHESSSDVEKAAENGIENKTGQHREGSDKPAETSTFAKSPSANVPHQDIELAADGKVAPMSTEPRGGTRHTIVSGRPGTYLGCGVTSCSGLAVSGEHGHPEGNIPHTAFVLRKTNPRDVSGGNTDSDDWQDTSAALGGGGPDSAHGDALMSTGHEVDKGMDGAVSTSPSHDVILATPLTLLSAREKSFRTELVRRKEHYNLGGTGKGNTADGEEGDVLRDSASLVQAGSSTRFFAAAEGRTPTEASRRVRSRGSRDSPAHVDVAQSPLMASTRPVETHQPLPEVCQAPNPDAAVFGSSRGSTRTYLGGTNEPNKQTTLRAEQEFVTFARPAAHWSVTTSVGASPGRARGKGVRAPGAAGRDVSGRFACRGYLLDPTFADHNPIILHPRLPRVNAGNGFSQVPDDSTLTDLVASQIAKGTPGGGKTGVEPFRNVVEVLHHNVSVSGERKAGKQRYFDEQGRPLSPVNFHHVYSSVEKRRRDHADPHLVPFP